MIDDHDAIEDSIAPYLLGADEAEDHAAVAAHLESCARCRSTAQRLQRALGLLPLGTDEVATPTELRSRLLAAAAAMRSPAPFPLRPPEPTARPVPPRHRVGGWSRLGAIAAAAVVAFALGAGIGLGVGRTLAPVPNPAVAVTQYSMAGSGAMAGAQGRVFELRQAGLTLVQFSGLPQPGLGKVYELWLIPSTGQPVPASVFAPDVQGAHVIVLGRALSGFHLLAVTQEAAPDGSSAPTQAPQLSGVVG